ncbi:MAG TPA: CpaF family protein [Fimbriiglobus sp.]|nr:CpaF family protein [Fimbriiglobus sp.]
MSRVSTNGAVVTLAPAVANGMSLRSDERFLRLKKDLHQQLITGMDLSAIGKMTEDELRAEVRRAAEELCRLTPDLISLSDRDRLVGEVLDETFGLGPLEPLLRDPAITDILVNGPKTVYVERNGQLEQINVAFHDEKHLLQIVQRIAGRIGRRVDETCPMVDARLGDGSRVNAVIPPLALDGTLLSIRRFGTRPFLIKDLIARKAMPAEMGQFLSACIKARMNTVISGGTGSGKTTLLNALSAFIPPQERIATIEDAAELRLQQPHIARMETRPPNIEGSGEVTTRDLVRNALRMRPDRIIVGECRGAETLDMLQAMNTGHDGSMTTVHANDTRDALGRLEMMVGMAGFDLPIWIIRRQISSAVQIVVQAARLLGGVRKIIRVSEITGMEGDVVSMHDIFAFKQTGVDENGVSQGYFYANGIRPKCLDRLETCGCRLPYEMFERRTLTM